jgi:hypothetical protein
MTWRGGSGWNLTANLLHARKHVFLLLTALIRNFYKLSWRDLQVKNVRTQDNKPYQAFVFSLSLSGQVD